MKGKTYARPAQNNELRTCPSPGIFPAYFFRSQTDGLRYGEYAFVLPSTSQFLLPPVSILSAVLLNPKRTCLLSRVLPQRRVFSKWPYQHSAGWEVAICTMLETSPFVSLRKATCVSPILEVTRLDQ